VSTVRVIEPCPTGGRRELLQQRLTRTEKCFAPKAQDAVERESADASAADDTALQQLHRIHLYQHAERVRPFIEAVIRLRE
jgi:hypothetical protein